MVEIFEYEKNNNSYWDKAKLYQQMVNKVLPIAETLYLRYTLLFLFKNTISYFIYIKNALQVKNMNKNSRRKQPILHNG